MDSTSLHDDNGCGYASCKPRPIQRCANIKAFTANLSFVILLHIGFYSYFVGVMRTLEKRFSLSSAQTGMLNSTNDIVQVFFTLILGYIAQRTNKPRILGLLMVFTFAAGLLYATPYFVYGDQGSTTTSKEAPLNSQIEKDGPMLCQNVNGTRDECQSAKEENLIGQESYVAYVLITIGSVAIGIGGSVSAPIGLPYIDDNAPKGTSSIYIGIVTSMYPWGGIIGFMLASACTSLPEGLLDYSLKQSDPNYIGAWWLGFIIIGTCVLMCGIPLFFFPKHMRQYSDNEESSSEDNHVVTEEVKKRDDIAGLIKDFPKLFCKLITNKTFWTHSFGQICAMHVIVGVLIQQPRFLEVHYHQTAAMAGMLAALSGAVTGVLGNMAGGILMRRWKLTPTGMAAMTLAGLFISCLGTSLKMLMPCPAINMIGHTDPAQPVSFELLLPCNANCSCPQARMEPICVGGTDTYFSPCYAGCTLYQNGTYGDCTCLEPSDVVTDGLCDVSCNMLIPYVIGFFVITFFSFMGRVPSTILTFRIVEPEMSSFAMATLHALGSILTFIPGPILFGALVDSTCLIWAETCGKTGNCLFYDIERLRVVPHGVALAIQFAGLLFASATLWLVKNDPKLKEGWQNGDNGDEDYRDKDNGDKAAEVLEVKFSKKSAPL